MGIRPAPPRPLLPSECAGRKRLAAKHSGGANARSNYARHVDGLDSFVIREEIDLVDRRQRESGSARSRINLELRQEPITDMQDDAEGVIFGRDSVSLEEYVGRTGLPGSFPVHCQVDGWAAATAS